MEPSVYPEGSFSSERIAEASLSPLLRPALASPRTLPHSRSPGGARHGAGHCAAYKCQPRFGRVGHCPSHDIHRSDERPHRSVDGDGDVSWSCDPNLPVHKGDTTGGPLG